MNVKYASNDSISYRQTWKWHFTDCKQSSWMLKVKYLRWNSTVFSPHSGRMFLAVANRIMFKWNEKTEPTAKTTEVQIFSFNIWWKKRVLPPCDLLSDLKIAVFTCLGLWLWSTLWFIAKRKVKIRAFPSYNRQVKTGKNGNFKVR